MIKYDLIPGNVYYCKLSSTPYIVLCEQPHIDSGIKHIHIENCSFNSDGWNFYTSANEFRNCTNKEILWLKECIKQNKYVPIEEIKEEVEMLNYYY